MTRKNSWLAWLPAIWFMAFLLGPLAMIMVASFASRGVYGGIEWNFGFENYLRAFAPLYASIFLRSFVLALMTSFFCLAVGFPLAMTMATATRRLRMLTLAALAIPFLTNLIIRVCGLKALTATDGPLSAFLSTIGIKHDPFSLSQNTFLVMFGMTSTYLPFMVFPLFGAIERFDFTLIEAAEDLGASHWQAMCKVLVPALRLPLASGFVLVFIPTLGEFVIPDLLGGAKVMLAGNLISDQFLKARDWPFGSALSVLLVALMSAIIYGIDGLGRARNRSDW